MRTSLADNGYERVGLRRDAGRQRIFLVHRLVLEAFIGVRPGREGNHKNGVKSDNRLENLEWATRGENQRHAYASGLQGCGERHGGAKLTEELVREIRERYAMGNCTQTELAGQYGVNQTLIGFIVRRVAWKHVA